MKFIKGVMIGSIVTAGIAMMWSDDMNINKKKIIKKGKQIAKRIGTNW